MGTYIVELYGTRGNEAATAAGLAFERSATEVAELGTDPDLIRL